MILNLLVTLHQVDLQRQKKIYYVMAAIKNETQVPAELYKEYILQLDHGAFVDAVKTKSYLRELEQGIKECNDGSRVLFCSPKCN